MQSPQSPLDKLAGRQLALITIGQLDQIDISIDQLRRRVHSGSIINLRPNVYRLAGAPKSWEQTVLAAALSAGEGAVVSHTTAAALWSLRHSDRYRAGIHLTCERQVRLKGVISHRAQLLAADHTVSQFIPITTQERTIVDWATMPGELSAKQLGQSVDDAIRRGLIGLERLRDMVDKTADRGGRRNFEPIRTVLAERIPGYRPDDSDFETEMNRLWDELGLPSARRQYRVTVEGHNYRLDRAIVEQKICVEWDSDRYHGYQSDKDHDSNRRARLASAGWFIIPVTRNTTAELIAQAVLRAYCDRGGQSALIGAQEVSSHE